MLVVVLPVTEIIDKFVMVGLGGELVWLSWELFGTHNAYTVFLAVGELSFINMRVSDL